MEENIISDLFDNRYIMDYQAALDLIKIYFDKEMPLFKLIQEYNESGYWGIKYSNQDVVVFMSCDRGGLEKVIIIDGKEFPLWQFDKNIINTEIASEKNIIFTLNVIKKFFEMM